MKKIAFIILLPFLSGCSTVVELVEKTAEVWMEPSVPVGEPEDRPTTVTLSMNATSQVNPNMYNDNVLDTEAEEVEVPEEKLPADPQEEAAANSAEAEVKAEEPAKEQEVAKVEEKEKEKAAKGEAQEVAADQAAADELQPQASPAKSAQAGAKKVQPKERIKAQAGELLLICDDLFKEPAAEVAQAAESQEPAKEQMAESPEPAKEQVAAPQAAEPSTDEIASAEQPQPEATPIAFKVIQLKDNSLFLQADFEGVFDDMEKALGTTYLAHDDFVLIPGEFKFTESFEVEEDTRYVAVIAAYNDYASKQWKGIVKIKPKGKEYSLLLHFDEQKVVIKKQEL